jgi:GrpB-like predicted nucleotidyltransferase (UPF0157 family)
MNYNSTGLSRSSCRVKLGESPAQESNSSATIRLYMATRVEYLPYNSESPRVANSVARVIEKSDSGLQVEHIGSTAVAGCWGKGIIDLLVTYARGRLASAQETLDHLGFQRQEGPEPFPGWRSMGVGSVQHFGRTYCLHAYVIEAGTVEARNLVRFRDLLRQNPDLRRAYETEKRVILARGITTATEYSEAKGNFIRAALNAYAYDEA